MSLQELNKQLGQGGANLNDQAPAALKELQGLTVSVLAGAAADTKINLNAIRLEDTLVSVLESAAGVFTERSANTTIADLRASGTLTVVTAAAGNTATVNDVVFTYSANPTAITDVAFTDGDDNANAAALASAINAYERRYQEGWPEATVVASVAANVVTVTAVEEGSAGNAITLAGTGGVTASAATLENGSDTGGILIDVDTTGDSLAVFWFNKNA